VSDVNNFPIPLGFRQAKDYASFFLGQITRQNNKNNNVVRVTFAPGYERAKAKKQILAAPQGVIPDQWVVGRKLKSGRVRFFGVNEQEILEYPVQVIPWNYITESAEQKSAAEYFRKPHETTVIHSTFPLIGRAAGRNGHVIIYDSEREVFLKGFSHVGKGEIRYSDVKFSSREKFEDEVEQYNQATPMTSATGQRFLLLVPEPKNEHEERGAHAVLDVGTWEELRFLQSSKDIDVGKKTMGADKSDAQASENNGVAQLDGNRQGNASGKALQQGSNQLESHESEVEFLKRFIKEVNDCGFYYKAQDLIRFHTCVKCGFLTVLGGAPGAGKSSLVKLYARAVLGKEVVKRRGLLTVDVNSSWVEPEDVLGHWGLDDSYRVETKTGIVPFLRTAIEATNLNMICLEEMNLARVEHYFSNFMQLSEQKDTERELAGVPLDPDSKNSSKRDCLPVNESVRIIGTNNFDETTQRFSDRFYDRCNYIELQDCPWDVFVSSKPDVDRAEFTLTVPWMQYKSWINAEVGKDDLKKIKDTVGDKYKKICEALKKSLNLMPSPRVGSLLINYIANRPSLVDKVEVEKDNGGEIGIDFVEDDCKMIALDEFIAQRILPRYTPSYLKDVRIVSGEIDEVLKELEDMPLSKTILVAKKEGLEGKPFA